MGLICSLEPELICVSLFSIRISSRNSDFQMDDIFPSNILAVLFNPGIVGIHVPHASSFVWIDISAFIEGSEMQKFLSSPADRNYSMNLFLPGISFSDALRSKNCFYFHRRPPSTAVGDQLDSRRQRKRG